MQALPLTAPLKRIPLAHHRHATPSGPWPWMDLESNEINHPPQVPTCIHEDCTICSQWLGYPQSHFPNWTLDQIIRCNIATAITTRRHDCQIYHVDVQNHRGKFLPGDERGFLVTRDNEKEFWHWLQPTVSNIYHDYAPAYVVCISG